MYHHAEFARSASKDVNICTREPQNRGGLGFRPLGRGEYVPDALQSATPTGWSVGTSIRTDIRRKKFLASRLSRSLKVMATDTDRSATYDFLLTFLSFKDISDIGRKFRIFFQPTFIYPPQVFPWNWVTRDWLKKLEWRGYQVEKKSDVLSRLNTIHECDEQDTGHS